MAVLYRSHFHALELQMELTRRNIPFSITSGIRFFEQAHIKDVAAYLKFVTNPRDELAFKRIVRLLQRRGREERRQDLERVQCGAGRGAAGRAGRRVAKNLAVRSKKGRGRLGAIDRHHRAAWSNRKSVGGAPR